MELNFEHKKINLIINGDLYIVTAYLTMNDLTYLLNYYSSSSNNYSYAIANVIKKHCVDNDEKLSLDNITNDKCAIELFVKELIDADENIAKEYEKLNDEIDISCRFVKAVINMWQELSKSIAITINNTINPILESLPKANDVFENIEAAKEPILKISRVLGEMLLGINRRINEIISKIKIPTISEEQKEQLCLSYEQWGTYGWTILPYADFNLFDTMPLSKKEANVIASGYCNKDFMDELFDDIRKLKGVQRKDFDEAVFNFENHNYKSCAMMLFSLLDSKLIRMQSKKNIKGKRRASGKSAVDIVMKRIEIDNDIKNQFFMLLIYKNILSCLNKVFENGNDFKKQPEIINRNFVDHGMMTNGVRKRDCIQLFLLYYNFLQFLEFATS